MYGLWYRSEVKPPYRELKAEEMLLPIPFLPLINFAVRLTLLEFSMNVESSLC